MAKNKRRAQSAAAGKPAEMLVRKVWTRKPHTQVVINKKAEQRRTFCRKGGTDGAVYLYTAVPNYIAS
ncbi:hypothetical protein [Paenibacillus daejeonensis]|uniref:hypothetical protein n=1 Tax=Paenibacillus daejeonensis TaxID=135193 RepID=UPI0003776852|nr:hypothetical protein [Paenibacillus daejeonensis]